MATYRCKDGDVLDDICWRHYGRTSGAIEAVFAANPGLADQGAIYVAGQLIFLPELTTTNPAANVVNLWD